jgi:hypothetical protein
VGTVWSTGLTGLHICKEHRPPWINPCGAQVPSPRKEIEVGFLTDIDSWFTRIGQRSDSQPVTVVQYGSTKSYSFRREALRGNFRLPELPDQGSLIAVLRAVQQFYLPDLTDDDFECLRQMLILIDDVILAGMKNPGNWILPKGFSEISFVKQRLEKNFPIEQILQSLLLATRLYIWLYGAIDESVKELIPHLLELEESFGSLQTRLSGTTVEYFSED